MIEVLSNDTVTTAAGTFDIKYSFDNGANWSNLTVNSNYFTNSGVTLSDGAASIILGNTAIATMSVQTGEKYLLGLPDRNYDNPSANHLELQLTAGINDGAGNLTQNSALFSRTVAEIDNDVKSFSLVQLDTANNSWVTANITLQFSAIVTTATLSDKVEFSIDESGGTANSLTPLSSIATFFDDDGNFILSSYGNLLNFSNMLGENAVVDFYPSETVGELKTKISDAVKSLFSVDLNSSADANLVTFVTNSDSDTFENTAGKFVIRSPLPGVEGQVFISAENDDIQNAFSFSDAQTPSGEPFSAVINGGLEKSYSGSELNLGNGTVLQINEDELVSAGWSGRTKNLVFSNSYDNFATDISVTENPLKYLSSVYGGSEKFSIPDFSLESLRLDKISLTNANLSERAMEIIDAASQKVNKFLGVTAGEIGKSYYRKDFVEGEIARKEALRDNLFGVNTPVEYAEMTKRLLLERTTASMFDVLKDFQTSIYKVISG